MTPFFLSHTATLLTCDGGLDVYHGLLLSQERRPLIDDAEGRGLLYAALQDEVIFEPVEFGLARLGVEHLRTC